MKNKENNQDNYNSIQLVSGNVRISGTIMALTAISCRNRLNKETSNKLLKGIKTIMFASTLSLLNPITVEAKTNIEPATVMLEDDYEMKKVIVGTAIGGTLVISLVGTAIYANSLKKKSKGLYRYNLENDSIADEEEAVKHIKIICK